MKCFEEALPGILNDQEKQPELIRYLISIFLLSKRNVEKKENDVMLQNSMDEFKYSAFQLALFKYYNPENSSFEKEAFDKKGRLKSTWQWIREQSYFLPGLVEDVWEPHCKSLSKNLDLNDVEKFLELYEASFLLNPRMHRMENEVINLFKKYPITLTPQMNKIYPSLHFYNQISILEECNFLETELNQKYYKTLLKTIGNLFASEQEKKALTLLIHFKYMKKLMMSPNLNNMMLENKIFFENTLKDLREILDGSNKKKIEFSYFTDSESQEKPHMYISNIEKKEIDFIQNCFDFIINPQEKIIKFKEEHTDILLNIFTQYKVDENTIKKARTEFKKRLNTFFKTREKYKNNPTKLLILQEYLFPYIPLLENFFTDDTEILKELKNIKENKFEDINKSEKEEKEDDQKNKKCVIF